MIKLLSNRGRWAVTRAGSLACLVILALLLVACGGGSGGGSGGDESGTDTETGESAEDDTTEDPPAELDEEELAAAWDAGFKAWTRESPKDATGNPDNGPVHAPPGSRCIECHGADPFEFAFIEYDDETAPGKRTLHDDNLFVDRAMRHLEREDAEALLEWIEAMRQVYDIEPRHRDRFRPLQPGGEVLGMEGHEGPEFTSSTADRDYAFGEYLADQGYLLATTEITAANADNAWREMRDLRIRELKVGVPFTRWSHDRRRGDDHRTFADWIPSISHDFDHPDERIAAREAYLENPTEANLEAYMGGATIEHRFEPEHNVGILDKADGHDFTDNGLPPRVVDGFYDSVQIGSHFMRLRAIDAYRERHGEMPPIPGLDADADVPAPFAGRDESEPLFVHRNGLWDIGAYFRDFGRAWGADDFDGFDRAIGNRCGDTWQMLGCPDTDLLPRDTVAELEFSLADEELAWDEPDHPNRRLSTSAEELRVPWFYMGWLIDPSLYYTHPQDDYPVVAAEYFMESLMHDGDLYYRDAEGDWQTLFTGGYPIHAAFVMAKRSIDLLTHFELDEDFDYGDYPYHHPDFDGGYDYACDTHRAVSGLYPITVNFNEHKSHALSDLHIARDPGVFNPDDLRRYRRLDAFPADTDSARAAKRDAHAQRYRLITANAYRLFLYNMLRELDSGEATVCHRSALRSRIARAAIFLDHADDSGNVSDDARAADEHLLRQLVCHIDAAPERIRVMQDGEPVVVGSEADHFADEYLDNLAEGTEILPACDS